MNYADILYQRAALAVPREDGTSDHLRCANARARVAWLLRWYERRPHPDPWAGVAQSREYLDFYLGRERNKARAWLEGLRARRLHEANVAVLNTWKRRTHAYPVDTHRSA